MGDAAEDLLSGDFCQVCGCFIGGGDGYPRSCGGCAQPAKSFEIDTEDLETKIENYGYTIKQIRKINYGKQLVLNNGAIVNKFSTGKINVQGTPDAELKEILRHEGYKVK